MKKSLLLVMLLLSAQIYAQPLARKGWLGARLVPENGGGVKITEIVGGTSKASNLQVSDIVLKINGSSITEPRDVSNLISKLSENDPITFTVKRNDKTIELKSKVAGRDREKSTVGEVIYERIPYKNGFLSAIINKPAGKGKFPAVLFIPGYTCSSVDGLTEDHPYGRIVNAFHQAGFVVLRVEKSGLGDSQNTADCSSTTLTDEIDGFKTGFQKLKQLPYVDLDNVFIIGHSMGGIIAPAISATEKVKGTIVYGTTAKSWFEYQLEMNRLQLKLANTPPFEYEENCRLQAEIAYDYFIQKKSLSDISSDPKKAETLKTAWQYNGKDMIFDRNQEYWRQIQDYPLLENWKNTSGNVLVLFGESDFQAFSKADHEQIVSTVNYYHPNAATLLSFPETDHYLAKSGSMQQAYDLFSQGKILELFQAFNPDVTQKSVDWAKKLSNK
ncbi:alpha/beta fold hydrolase [Flavobacterium sp.]|uniref:alpha/beta fold hydrolase n=1 Tax=Flavobacterium sp. TaxID=239 RepID=UPI003B990BE2